MDQTDPIYECHRRHIAVRPTGEDKLNAKEAWAEADEAETLRVLRACCETVTGLSEDVEALVLPHLWPERVIRTSDLRTLLEPHAIDYIAREMAAEYALKANRRMELAS